MRCHGLLLPSDDLHDVSGNSNWHVKVFQFLKCHINRPNQVERYETWVNLRLIKGHKPTAPMKAYLMGPFIYILRRIRGWTRR